LEEEVRLGLLTQDEISFLKKSLEVKLDTIYTVLSRYLKEASLPDSFEIDEAFKQLMHKNKFISSLRVRNSHSYDVRESEMFKKSFKAWEDIQS
jgi:hypothetical protein